uniref:Uncharacterized protein n=1 Tax=Arundo donax TaxID=35708 RepID=A0A0A9GPL6_ARUDO
MLHIVGFPKIFLFLKLLICLQDSGIFLISECTILFYSAMYMNALCSYTERSRHLPELFLLFLTLPISKGDGTSLSLPFFCRWIIYPH